MREKEEARKLFACARDGNLISLCESGIGKKLIEAKLKWILMFLML